MLLLLIPAGAAPPPSPLAPAAPSAIWVNNITDRTANVTIAPVTGTIARYETSLDNLTWSSIGLALWFNKTGLTASTAYTVYVRAVNTDGLAGPAASAAFTTAAAIPADPRRSGSTVAFRPLLSFLTEELA